MEGEQNVLSVAGKLTKFSLEQLLLQQNLGKSRYISIKLSFKYTQFYIDTTSWTVYNSIFRLHDG